MSDELADLVAHARFVAHAVRSGWSGNYQLTADELDRLLAALDAEQRLRAAAEAERQEMSWVVDCVDSLLNGFGTETDVINAFDRYAAAVALRTEEAGE